MMGGMVPLLTKKKQVSDKLLLAVNHLKRWVTIGDDCKLLPIFLFWSKLAEYLHVVSRTVFA